MPVFPGQEIDIAANEWNDLLLIRQQWLANGRNPLLPQDSNQLGGPGWCWIKNTTANALAFGDILGIGKPIITLANNSAEKYNGIRWKGVAPSTSTSHHGRYVVLQEPAAANAIVRAVFSGVTYCKLTITHASDDYCDITNNVTSALTTGALGSSRVLDKDTGTGSGKWGLIRVGEPSGEILVYNATGSAINAGNSGTATVYTGTPGSEASTGQTLTVFNRSSVNWANAKFGSAAILQKGNAYVSPQQT